MSVETTQQKLDALRRRVIDAEADLYNAVVAACPEDHQPVQHRDGRPAWCEWCGRDNKGRVRGRRKDNEPL